ncbi:MAG: hypothetical protein ABFC34_05890 [Methanobacterium sp.]
MFAKLRFATVKNEIFHMPQKSKIFAGRQKIYDFFGPQNKVLLATIFE